MRGERGQATVEWVGLVLALAIVLGAVARVLPSEDDRNLGDTLVSTLTCAARGGCEEASDGGVAPSRGGGPARQFTAPPLVPVAPRPLPVARQGRFAEPGGLRRRLEQLRDAVDRYGSSRARRRLGTLWRRAWLACFAYERYRLNRLVPDTVLPGRAPPPREAVRVVSVCLSPLDLFRDFGHRLPR